MKSIVSAGVAAAALISGSAHAGVTVPGGAYSILHFTFAPGATSSVLAELHGSAGYWVDFGNGDGYVDPFVEHGIWACDGSPIACRDVADPETGTVLWSYKIVGDDLWFRVDNLQPNRFDCPLDGEKWCYISLSPVEIGWSSDQDFTVEVTSGSVPEPTSWAMMIAGLGLAGAALRRRAAINSAATM